MKAQELVDKFIDEEFQFKPFEKGDMNARFVRKGNDRKLVTSVHAYNVINDRDVVFLEDSVLIPVQYEQENLYVRFRMCSLSPINPKEWKFTQMLED